MTKFDLRIFILCILLTLGLHGLGIYFLKDLKTNFHTYHIKQMESRYVGNESKMRNQQLVSVFHLKRPVAWDEGQNPVADAQWKALYSSPQLHHIVLDEPASYHLANEDSSFMIKTLVEMEDFPKIEYRPPLFDDVDIKRSQFVAELTRSVMQLSQKIQSTSEKLEYLKMAKAAANEHGRLLEAGSVVASRRLSPHSEFNRSSSIIKEVSSRDFSVNTEYIPYQEGYLFHVQLAMNQEIHFQRLKQNFFFLIDRSNSIPEVRYEEGKKAVALALDRLQPGDTFNILIFDKNMALFASENMAWSEEAVLKAKEFLQNQKHGGLWAATDLYSTLSRIIPEKVAKNEVNIAILLSDGDPYLKSEKQKEAIGKWTKKNEGKVSLYAVASGSGNHLALLDLLSAFNKGSLYYCLEDQSLSEIMLQLMQIIQNPVGKEIVVTAIPKEKGVEIILLPSTAQLPNLYLNSPYNLLGWTNQKKDFVLFFQGKNCEQNLDVKQIVGMENAKLGSPDLLGRLWAILQAYSAYAMHFTDGKRDHVIKAKQFLAPYKIAPAFE